VVLASIPTLACGPRTVYLSPPWPTDRTAAIVVSDANGNVLSGPPILVANGAVTEIQLPERAGLTLYAGTFDATTSVDLARCAVTLDGSGPGPTPDLNYASNSFDSRSVSQIELHQTGAFPFALHYPPSCTAIPMSPCAATVVEAWPHPTPPLARVVAVSDDLAFGTTRTGVQIPIGRYDFSTSTASSSTVTLGAGETIASYGGHIIAVDRGGEFLELDQNLRVLRSFYFHGAVPAMALGTDGSLLVGLDMSCGANAHAIASGSISSTVVHSFGCPNDTVSLAAATRRDWRAWAFADQVAVLSGTVSAAPILQLTSPDYTLLAISPDSVVAGPRTSTWQRLDRATLTWTAMPRPPFANTARSAAFTIRGALLAGGEGGAFAIYASGSWCLLDVPDKHFHFDGISLAPSGHVAFAAGNDSNASGTLLRIHLPAGL
jgi:hypothetical protein